MKPMKCACAAPASPMMRAADGEGLQPECVGALAERPGRRLVLADGAQHPAPRAAQQPLEREVEHDDDGGEQRRG